MVKETIEEVLKTKVEPLVDKAMHRYLGITVDELRKDITEKIEDNPLISYDIDTSVPFKAAKKVFKKEFLTRMLQSHFGNVSEVAKITGLNRRSVHRAVKELHIDISKVRKKMIKTKFYQREAIYDILTSSLDDYKTIIRPNRLEKMYKNADKLSQTIVKTLPSIDMTWDDAEKF